MSSMQVLPWKTTVCWVPSKVSRVPPSCWARSTPALYGVAGSLVVDTTRIGGRPVHLDLVLIARRRHRPERARVQGREAGELAVAHERRRLAGATVLVDHLGAVGDVRLVHAVDRDPDIGGVVVVPLGVAAHVEVGQGQHGVAGAVFELGERLGEVAPQARRVQRQDGADDRVAVAQPAGILGLRRVLDQRVDQAAGTRRPPWPGRCPAGSRGSWRSRRRSRRTPSGTRRPGGCRPRSGRRWGRRRRRGSSPAPCRDRPRRRPPRSGCRTSSRGRSASRRRAPARIASRSLATLAVPTLARNSLPILSTQRWTNSLVLLLDVRRRPPACSPPGVGPQPVVVGVGVAPHRGRGVGDAARVEADEIEPLTHRLRQRRRQLTRRPRHRIHRDRRG